jgi:uroporphyrinogen-III synthase
MHKVLSTRIITQSLIDKAAAKGVSLEAKDFISVEPAVRPEDMPLIDSILGRKDIAAVFTSKHAVDAIAGYIAGHKHGTSPGWTIYCLSAVTVNHAAEAFPDAAIHGQGSYAADLAAAIAADGVSEVYFFCGNKRRDTLPENLRKEGVTVHETIVYHTSPTPVQVPGDYEGVVFFSPSAVESFFSMNKLDEKAVCFAIGKTTAETLRKEAPNQVVVSNSQQENTLVQSVIDYYDGQKA